MPGNPLPEYLAVAGITRGPHEVSVVWHSFRHTCAAALVSGMWARRWTLEEVKGLLGHESITTTERYAHLADSALRQAAAETYKPAISPRPVAVAPSVSAKSSMFRCGATFGI
jgi:site-specific recombinase XerD